MLRYNMLGNIGMGESVLPLKCYIITYPPLLWQKYQASVS